jgi:hypothetical protein
MMMTKTQYNLNAELAALDAISPVTHPARDAVHFRAIIAAVNAQEAADEQLRAAVAAARDAGDSWTAIGVALGTSRQNAQQRFGGRVEGN